MTGAGGVRGPIANTIATMIKTLRWVSTTWICEKDGGDLPTDGIIEYELDKLAEMSQKELLIQLIALEQLKMPQRERRVKLSQYEADFQAAAEEVIEKMRELKLDAYTAAITDVFDRAFPVATNPLLKAGGPIGN